MNFEAVVNNLKKLGSVMSVEIKPDGTYGEICLEAANDIYLDSVNVKREDFVPGKPYSNFVQADPNYEAMSYRCVKENKMIHSYVNAGFYNAWMEIYMIPLMSDRDDKAYYLFSYDMTPMPDADKLADVSPDTAYQVIKTSVKLRETDDFKKSMNSVILDIRLSCEANRCCIMLTDFKNKNLSVLCESIAEDDDTPRMETYLNDDFFEIVATWDSLIAGSNCYIIHDADELEKMKEVNRPWAESLIMAGVYSLVIYPLVANGETIGYIWATNFNNSRTLTIKAILEVTAFILAAEISNHQLFKKMKILSNEDLLTGLYNRNAMNNRISAIVTGEEVIRGQYGVVFADLNGLKQVNDKEGHIAGDNLLKAAASVLRDTFADIPVYRVGGDEFLVIVTNRTEQEFDKLVETLIDKSNKHDTVKLAVGTCFGDTDLDIRKAMHLADERMYKNKEEFYRTHVRGR